MRLVHVIRKKGDKLPPEFDPRKEGLTVLSKGSCTRDPGKWVWLMPHPFWASWGWPADVRSDSSVCVEVDLPEDELIILKDTEEGPLRIPFSTEKWAELARQPDYDYWHIAVVLGRPVKPEEVVGVWRVTRARWIAAVNEMDRLGCCEARWLKTSPRYTPPEFTPMLGTYDDPMLQKASEIIARLKEAEHTAYVVGGAVRDLLRKEKPHDIDIATSAKPEEVMAMFEKAIPTGLDFGTVTVVKDGIPFEVTTYRGDGNYGDGRHPDSVRFLSYIEGDLARRDFTINAMAYDPIERVLVDPFGGQYDLRDGIIRAVGDPLERFREDSLRMLRAVRFACRFGFRIEDKTREAMKQLAGNVTALSAERIAKELLGILTSGHPAEGIRILEEVGILKHILPEIQVMVGYDQNNPHHHLNLFEHTLTVLEGVPGDPVLRLAALLHDVGKPVTRTTGPDGVSHYYDHAKVGAEMADQICRRLRLSNEVRLEVIDLIREHMLQEEVSKKTLRRIALNKGMAFLEKLIQLGEADRKASSSGSTGKLPALLQELKEEGEPPKLAITGNDVMAVLGLKPGPEVGRILSLLRDRVLEDPSLNKREALMELLKTL